MFNKEKKEVNKNFNIFLIIYFRIFTKPPDFISSQGLKYSFPVLYAISSNNFDHTSKFFLPTPKGPGLFIPAMFASSMILNPIQSNIIA